MRAVAQSPHRPKSNRKNNNSKLNPAPWWNEECELAVKRRKEGLKIYRTAPTIENYRLYKKICRDCKKVLKTQKRNGWKRFCGEFNHKTPTPAIWRLIKLFKKKSQTFSPHDCETLTQMQLATIDKLCPPSCLHKINDNPSSSSPADSEQASTFQWLDNPFSLHELEHVLNSLKKTSAPGLDQIDNLVLSILPQSYRHIMLRILNNLFAYKLFPKPWLHSLVVLIPKPNGTGVRPISLLSSILKVTEKIIYNRLRWLAETQFIIPSTQFGFRSFRSCNDNLSILTNHIHLGFLKGEYTVCIFVDIAGAFDNIIPNTLIHDLDSLGIPDKTKNFIKNLICERKLNFIINDDIYGPYYTHKGTPQGSVLSPLLFNLYLKDVSKHLHTNSSSLQYADDLAIYSTHRSLEEALSSVWVSLKRVKKYLQLRGLEISPSKSQGVVFTRKRGFDSSKIIIEIDDQPITFSNSARFLGVILDHKLRGKEHLLYLINKGSKIANIITCLSGVWWGAHPHLLMSIYRAVFRGSVEYGSHIFNYKRLKHLSLKLDRIQYRIIRVAYGASTPINILHCEAREPPLRFRFDFLASKYIYKNFSIRYNPVIQSLKMLLVSATTRNKKIKLIKEVSIFKTYISQKYTKAIMFRSVLAPNLIHGFEETLISIPYDSFEPSSKKELPSAAINAEFQEYLTSLTDANTVSIYTNGSKAGLSAPAGVGVYSPELEIFVKQKLPPETTVFSAEAWAIYQALLIALDANSPAVAVISDSKSVLEAIASHCSRANMNYIIPRIRAKIMQLCNKPIKLTFIWVPAHKGIAGNETADMLAKSAAKNVHGLSFKVPFSDFFALSRDKINRRFMAYLNRSSETKGKFYFSLYKPTTLYSKPWFYKTSLKRKEIVTINRLRSNHYNLNYSLHRKNMVQLSSCPCGDSRQDANHVIFRCNITKDKAKHLFRFFKDQYPHKPIDIFPLLKNPHPRLCRLLLAFAESAQFQF